MEWWQAVGAIATIVVGGLTVLGGFFGWLSRQFTKINEHLTTQDVKIGKIETDLSWVKTELEKKQDRED